MTTQKESIILLFAKSDLAEGEVNDRPIKKHQITYYQI